MDLVKKQVLKKIKSSLEEQLEFEKVVKRLKSKIKRSANRLGIKCEPFIGGSFGKNTYIKGSFDVDIFCRFDKDYDDDKISRFLESILIEAKVKFKKQKGSRDYFSGVFGPRKLKIKFEAVPVRKIRKAQEALNSTDVSYLHVEFLKKKCLYSPDLTDEIRLAKQFFKAKKLYGAESYIGGFSGHVIDILIAFYGSLENLLNDAKNWEENKFIDISNFYNSYDEALRSIGEDKKSALVLIDPIIKERNAARALSFENYARFLMVANAFERFSLEDFEIRNEDVDEVIGNELKFAKENNLKIIGYKFKLVLKEESEDIVGSKLKRLFKKVKKYFESLDFKIFSECFFIDISKGVCVFIFHFEKSVLPQVKKVEGPKVYMTEAIDNFLKGREEYFIHNLRVCTYEKRRITNVSEVLNITCLEFEKMLGKDLSFVRKVRILK